MVEIELTKNQRRASALQKVKAALYTLSDTNMERLTNYPEEWRIAERWLRYMKQGVNELENLFIETKPAQVQ